MLIPIRTDYRLRQRPIVNYAIVGVNVAVFLARFVLKDYQSLIRPFLLYPVAPRMDQFFTAMFLHADWMHLLGNMLFLWVFGNAVNDRFGHVGYAAFYLAGGVLSGIGYIVLGAQSPVLGASGAISAVTGAYLVLFPRVRVTLLAWLLYVLIPIEISSVYFLGFQFLFNLYSSYSSANAGVAYVAHSAGYVYGIGLAFALLGLGLLPRDVFDLLSLWRTRRRRTAYRRMVARGYDPFSYQGAAPAGAEQTSRWTQARSVVSTPSVETPSAQVMALREEITKSHGMGDFSRAAEKYLELTTLADEAVLPRQQLLDVGNQLMSDHKYSQAADAYERLLRHYPGYEHVSDIQLMLGIIYGRYLQQTEQATIALRRALDGLHDARKRALAMSELQALSAG